MNCKNPRKKLLDYFNEHKEAQSVKHIFRYLENHGKRLGYTTIWFETKSMEKEGILESEDKIANGRVQTHLRLVTKHDITT